jgi:hypothetical protein
MQTEPLTAQLVPNHGICKSFSDLSERRAIRLRLTGFYWLVNSFSHATFEYKRTPIATPVPLAGSAKRYSQLYDYSANLNI